MSFCRLGREDEGLGRLRGEVRTGLRQVTSGDCCLGKCVREREWVGQCRAGETRCGRKTKSRLSRASKYLKMGACRAGLAKGAPK